MPNWRFYREPSPPKTHLPNNMAHSVMKAFYITGVSMSSATAKAAGGAGRALNVVNKAAPVLIVTSLVTDAVQIGKSVVEDAENHSSRNTIKKTATVVAATAGGVGGCTAGAAIGTAIFPGIGTIVGGAIGAIYGSSAAERGAESASEAILDNFNYNIDDVVCEKCGEHFKLRRYKEGHAQKRCEKCR